MKILLTGASGYIGKRLLPVLVENGHDVICGVRDIGRFSRCRFCNQEKKQLLQARQVIALLQRHQQPDSLQPRGSLHSEIGHREYRREQRYQTKSEEETLLRVRLQRTGRNHHQHQKRKQR